MCGVSCIIGVVICFSSSFWRLLLMLNNVFDECPGFEFFSAEDVLRVRSLGLPDDFELWEHEHFEGACRGLCRVGW